MTTGYLSAGKCWQTSGEAIDAYYSAISTPVFISGSNFIKIQYLKDAGVWKLYGWATPNLAAWGTPAVTVPNTNVYGTCEYFPDITALTTPEALTLCALFAGLLVVGFTYRVIAQALNSKEGNQDE